IHLLVYKKMTLKQFSDYLGKGKTTIHHHIRKLENEHILIWEEKKGDRKKLKTRFYSISALISEGLEEKNSLIERMRIETLINNYLSELMIIFLEKQIRKDESLFDNLNESFVQRILLSEESLPLYKELFINSPLIRENRDFVHKVHNNSMSITHISTHFLIPVKELFEWNLKHNTEED
ncbi:MAG: helix-turn-helix domain-containing protein, partial [Promethearchaeota archaeon]